MKHHLKAKRSIGKPLSARRTSKPTASDKLFARDNIDVTADAASNDRNVLVSQLGRIDAWLTNSKGELVPWNEGTAADGSTMADGSLCVVHSLHNYASKTSSPEVEAAFEAMMQAMPLKSLRLGEPLFTLRSLQEDFNKWLWEANEVDPNTRLIRKRSAAANLSLANPREGFSPAATEPTDEPNPQALARQALPNPRNEEK